VKEEGNNLNILALALLQMVDCEPLQLHVFGHAMSKAFQYATSNDQVCVGMTCVIENCPINLAKDNNLDRKKWQRLLRVGQGL
jgi:hypothetical protein